MSYTCFIVDDQPHGINLLKKYIERHPDLQLLDTEADPLKVPERFEDAQFKPDFTFLDIDMPGLSGLELSPLIQGQTEVIFVTAFSEFAHKSYEQHVVDYLVKPVSYERFCESIERAIRQLNQNKHFSRDSFFIQHESKGKRTRVFLSDILYIESQRNYQKIHLLSSKEALSTYMTMAEILDQLPQHQFLRVHKSFIVNEDMIIALDTDYLFLKGDVRISIGQSYYNEIVEKIDASLIKSKRRK